MKDTANISQGDNWILCNSYAPILSLLSAPVLSSSRCTIHRQTTCTAIRTPAASVEPYGKTIVVTLSLSTGTETSHVADAVIVAVPLGCLKRGDIRFEPQLPQGIQLAVEQLGYGTLEKVRPK
jgi:hypothetical protein